MATQNPNHEAYLGQDPKRWTPLGEMQPVGRGKVRDLYALGEDRLVFVTTDRVSAFDVVMAEGVPHKGRILTAIAVHWFERTAHILGNHWLSASVEDLPGLSDLEREQLRGRVLVVRRTRPTPIEWVVRTHLAGSAWVEYQNSGTLWGQAVPAGLVQADPLPELMLTPTTKDQHKDLPLSLAEARARVGSEIFERAQSASFALVRWAQQELQALGFLLADTKFEFGIDAAGELLLIDEALTPDSSRLWPMDTWRRGSSPPSFDKQILRDHLLRSGWNQKPPPPRLPEDLLLGLGAKYLEFCRLLTGKTPEGVPRDAFGALGRVS